MMWDEAGKVDGLGVSSCDYFTVRSKKAQLVNC